MISNQLLILPVHEMTESGKACMREIIPSNQQAIAKGLQLWCSVPSAGELTLMRPELSPLAESIQCNTWNDSVMLRLLKN